MNDYTCPECIGTGTIYLNAVMDVGSCPACKGEGRLLDRRSKTVSDRRKYDGPGMERRRNFTFTDRRKRI